MLDDVSCICKVVSASIFMRDYVLEQRENTIYLLLLQCGKQHLWLLWSQIVLKGMQGKSWIWGTVTCHDDSNPSLFKSSLHCVQPHSCHRTVWKAEESFQRSFLTVCLLLYCSAMCPPGELTCKFLDDPPVTAFHLVLETMQLCKNDSCQVRIVIWVVETQTQVISYRQTNTFAFWTISPDQLLVIFN